MRKLWCAFLLFVCLTWLSITYAGMIIQEFTSAAANVCVSGGYVDLSTATVVEETGDPITLDWTTNCRVTFSINTHEYAYVYVDFGANYFDGNYVFYYDYRITSSDTWSEAAFAGVSNSVSDDIYNGGSTDHEHGGYYEAANADHNVTSDEGTDGPSHDRNNSSDCEPTLSLNQTIYCRVERLGTGIDTDCWDTEGERDAGSRDGGDCNSGNSVASAIQYRYFFPLSTVDNGSTGRAVAGYVENIEIISH